MASEKDLVLFVAANPEVVKDHPELLKVAQLVAAACKKKGIDPAMVADGDVQGYGLCKDCLACEYCITICANLVQE